MTLKLDEYFDVRPTGKRSVVMEPLYLKVTDLSPKNQPDWETLDEFYDEIMQR